MNEVNLPSKSKSQQRLMAAAEHGTQFPMAKQVRSSMTMSQLGDFAKTPTKGLPAHVGHPHKNLGAYLHKPKKGR